MSTSSRAPLPYLIPLLLACTALFALTAYLLGGSPTARRVDRPAAEALGEAVEKAPPILRVVIDAGHGGEDGGTSSAGGTSEKELNLSVAFALRDLFEAAGVPVVMTRTEDVLLYDRNVDFKGRKKVLDLAARRLVAEKTAAEAEQCGGVSLFISIHMNAFPQPQYRGMQVWYGTGHPLSAEAATGIQSAALAVMPDNHRKTKAAGSNIYLLDRIKSPAVLVECGFLSNPEEAELLSREEYRYAVAAVVFAGVIAVDRTDKPQ